MAAKELLSKPILTTIRMRLPAGGAKPGKDVTPLGQAGLNIMAFCKDFNARTQKYKPETPMSVRLTAYKDKTFDFAVKSPRAAWFLKKAAGVEKASGRPGHVVVSSVSVKHVYDIATVKKADPGCEHLSLESVCKSVVGTASSMGIKVVNQLE